MNDSLELLRRNQHNHVCIEFGNDGKYRSGLIAIVKFSIRTLHEFSIRLWERADVPEKSVRFELVESKVDALLNLLLELDNLKVLEITVGKSNHFECSDEFPFIVHDQCSVIRRFLLLEKSWLVALRDWHDIESACLDNVFSLPKTTHLLPTRYKIGHRHEDKDNGVISAFCTNVLKNLGLDFLYISNFGMLPATIATFEETLKNCRLKSLVLGGWTGHNRFDGSNNIIESEYDDFQNEKLNVVVKNLPQNLEELAIGFRMILRSDIIDQFFIKLSTIGLKKLHFNGSWLSLESLSKLTAHLLCKNCALTDLTLCGNSRYDGCNCIEFARAIRDNQTLTKITLHDIVADSDLWVDAFRNNRRVKFVVIDYMHIVELSDHFFESIFECNYTIVEMPIYYDDDAQNNVVLNRFLERNLSVQWNEAMHQRIVDYVIGMASLELPAYVLLWIFDWIPNMYFVSHFKKIQLIVDIVNSIRRCNQRR